MPDPYANIETIDDSVALTIADRLEKRAAQKDQRQMLSAYLEDIKFPPDADVIEVGCGTGAVSRVVAAHDSVANVMGLDPSRILIERAAKLSAKMPNLRYKLGEANSIPFEDCKFDVAIFHTVLCHIKNPEQALAEAMRVLRPGGHLAIFDGDYATATVSIAMHDPLQACSSAVTENNVTDRFIIRRISAMARTAGFLLGNYRSHGYAETADPSYMMGHLERGADLLLEQGVIGSELAQALKSEAKRRVTANKFFGHIAYASLVALKPFQQS